MALVKSGWLWRQSSILRRWKKNWFVLYLDGTLAYYHDESQRDMEGRVHVRHGCRHVRAGRQCRAPQPPEGKSRECLVALALRDGSSVTLCAESEDDAVRGGDASYRHGSPVPVPTPLPEGIPGSRSASSSGRFVPAAPGGTRVIVREDPYRISGDQMALGLLAGAATGAALGSFMWMPCWF
ncbi:PKHB1 protein, partial [Eudromia elegans]|nr:PKHB1 protein [Eudromia elegans]